MSPFDALLTEAVRDVTERGYVDAAQLEYWTKRLRQALKVPQLSVDQLRQQVRKTLEMRFEQALKPGALKRRLPQVSRYTIEQVRPHLRAELARRVQVSADLIKLNREQAIDRTMQRFAGWASSVPPGGSRVTDRGEVKAEIRKALRQQGFEERRVAIDQGHKLMANIDAVIATQTGAIAAMWRSHWRQAGYDYRPDHRERDQKVYAIRGSWAMEKGLVNKGDGYLDEMTQPAEEPFCRCYFVYLQNLRDLPAEMLTAKGRNLLDETRIKAA